MFDTVLIANRGEIARRVIRTARRMGLRTVAVYSDADAGAAHVAEADLARRIGPAAADSYLNQRAILDAARETGAGAIHPGYGFLAENAAFAEACAAAGLVFVGPPAAAIRAMGSKADSKRLMAAAGVPLLPGFDLTGADDAAVAMAAARLGYPLLVKASAGGGGKGMRMVATPAALPAALAGARREAMAAFGDPALLLERHLDHPRHVEVQVFADAHGGVVHLFDRDCSVQRRHQKVIEEAPAPGLSDTVRAAMAAAAITAARAVAYQGAGTVEFLYQDGAFHFIEMNTRLQVEHPVTEMITGIDLVEWQFLIAAGQPLPLDQDAIRCRGHAIEARLYAEDPGRGFLPATGPIVHLRFPDETAALRVEAGMRTGEVVTPHYDPMIAKLVAWGEDRDSARRRLVRAIGQTELAGPACNLGLLAAILTLPAFAAGGADTGLIGRHSDVLTAPAGAAPAKTLVFAAIALLLERDHAVRAATRLSGDPHSPWRSISGWRLNADNHHDFRLKDGATEQMVTVHFRADGWIIDLADKRLDVRGATRRGATVTAEIDLVRQSATVVIDGTGLWVAGDGRCDRLWLDDPAQRAAQRDDGDGRVVAPMAGTVARVLVKAGQTVTRGQPLAVVEAMKMEHTLTAPADGLIAAIHVRAGETVADGLDLMTLQAAEAAA